MNTSGTYDSEKLHDANYVIGVLCSEFLREYGEASKDIISRICYERGLALGKRLGAKIKDKSFETAVAAFVRASEKSESPAVLVSLSEERAVLQGSGCPLGLKGRGRPVCEAMMPMDQGILESASNVKVNFKVVKSIAGGDENCEVVFEVQPSD